jgi:DNA invertase Pin-like site-specific DNA recombinase
MRAIIYTRVSSDLRGGRSVDQQEKECRAYCKRMGWEIVDVLQDNDKGASRHSKKDRPEYRRLRDVLEPGMVLVTWEASRAQRDLKVYAELRDLCADRGVKWAYGGSVYDLNTSDGRFTTGLHALLSEHESDKTHERVLRDFRDAALKGRPHGKIIYGYRAEYDKATGIMRRVPDAFESAVIKEAARRVLAGETTWAVAQDLNATGVPTPGTSKEWVGQRLGLMLKRPTYAGLRSHHGSITQGQWEPLISLEDHQQLVAILSNPNRRTQRGVEPTHLLSGIAKCGVCGARVERLKNGGYDSYTCSSPKRHVGRRVPYVDKLVTEAILARLETATSIEEFANPKQQEALAEARRLRDKLEAAADRYSNDEISDATLARIEANLTPRIRELEKLGQEIVDPLVGELLGPNARATWELWPVSSRRIAVRSLARVTIMPAPRGRVFRPEFVKFEWL